jgi:TRAP-type transport system small permease protein
MQTKGRGVYRLLDHLLVIGLAAMVLMVLGNVVLRYLFNSGLEFSEEVSRFTFVWLTFIGAVIALKEGLHLGMDTVVKRLGRRGRLACYWISHLLMLWCCVLLWQGSWEQAKVNLGNYAPVSGIPIAAVYGVGLFASVLMGITLLQNLWKVASGKMNTEELIDIRESEGLPAEAVKEA